MRRSFLPLAVLVVLTTPTIVAAAPTKQACVTAYEETQISMRRGRLLHARETLQTCLNDSCPAVLRSDCADWLKEVEARTPSVVVECTAGGAPGADARLFVDGQAREGGIDGKAMELDPGPHTFRVEPASGAPVSVEVVIREGEKLKVVSVPLPEARAGSGSGLGSGSGSGSGSDSGASRFSGTGTGTGSGSGLGRRPVPWTVYAAAGVGVAAAAGFGVFAITGMSKKDELEPCKPNCSSEQISSVRSRFIVADVFLGVTAVAGALATYFFLTRPTVDGTRAGLTVDPGGARLTF